jgi:hypothetical protein
MLVWRYAAFSIGRTEAVGVFIFALTAGQTAGKSDSAKVPAE